MMMTTLCEYNSRAGEGLYGGFGRQSRLSFPKTMPQTRPLETEREQSIAKYRNWDDIEPRSYAFRDLIQRDPVVCDNCFLRRYETVTREWWRGSFGWMQYNRWDPIPGTHVEVPANTMAQGTRLACSNCGHRKTKDRPIPKHLIDEYTDNISDTLDFKEIAHSRDRLFVEVHDRNTCENQGRQDSHVFAPAVKDAIRVSQRR